MLADENAVVLVSVAIDDVAAFAALAAEITGASILTAVAAEAA